MKTVAREKRHRRVRARVQGSAERPRLVVFRGTRTLSAQLVDDVAGSVLLTVTNSGKKLTSGSGLAAATALGTELATRAKTKKITRAVYDRAGYRYHGAIKEICEAVRKGGVSV